MNIHYSKLIVLVAIFLGCSSPTDHGIPKEPIRFRITEHVLDLADLHQNWFTESKTILLTLEIGLYRPEFSIDDLIISDLPEGFNPRAKLRSINSIGISFEGIALNKIKKDTSFTIIVKSSAVIEEENLAASDEVYVIIKPYQTRIITAKSGSFTPPLYTETPLRFNNIRETIYVTYGNFESAAYYFQHNDPTLAIGSWKFSPSEADSISDVNDIQNYIFYDKDNVAGAYDAFGGDFSFNPLETQTYTISRKVGMVFLAQRKSNPLPILVLKVLDQISIDQNDFLRGGTVIIEYGEFFRM